MAEAGEWRVSRRPSDSSSSVRVPTDRLDHPYDALLARSCFMVSQVCACGTRTNWSYLPNSRRRRQSGSPRWTDREGHIARGAAFALSSDDVCAEFPAHTNSDGCETATRNAVVFRLKYPVQRHRTPASVARGRGRTPHHTVHPVCGVLNAMVAANVTYAGQPTGKIMGVIARLVVASSEPLETQSSSVLAFLLE